MKRLLYLACSLTLWCGCHNQGPPGRDPFFGRTTVPPPPTGAASAAIDPYLSGGRNPMAAAIPPAPGHADVAVPGAAATAPISAVQPSRSQGWISAGSAAAGSAGPSAAVADLRSAAGTRATAAPSNPGWPDIAGTGASQAPSVIRIVEPAAPTQPINSACAGAGTASERAGVASGQSGTAAAQAGVASGQPPSADSSLGAAILAGRPRVVRTLPPRSLATTNPGTGTSPAGPNPPPGQPLPMGNSTSAGRGAVDIFDLPPVDRGATASGVPTGAVQVAAWSRESAGGQASCLVSGEVPPGEAAPVSGAVYEQPAQFAAQARYGYDPEYRWLRGRLEYSAIDRRWKLRYIPIDGQTDRYGGSVILADEALLAGCERGQFVEVQGHVGKHDPRAGFAPEYVVSALKRLGS